MPRTRGDTKSELLCTRLTPSIKDAVEGVAAREGLTSSEWVRGLILRELKSGYALPTFRVPTVEEG